MNRKLKIAYWVVMALNAIVLVVDIITANYFGAAMAGFTIIWLVVCYCLVSLICQQDAMIDELHRKVDDYYDKLTESAKREGVRQMEFNKMRERAESAEKQLQQMIDDTPARGKDGRYVKRDSE